MNKRAFPILATIRDHTATSHGVPLSVALEPCALCKQVIEKHEDATVFQEFENGPSYMAHSACDVAHLQRVATAFGKYGARSMGAALRRGR